MDAQEPMSTPSEAPKSKPRGKGKGKSPEPPKGKRSLNLSLPQEDYERLAIHALRADMTISDLVAQLARTHLREYHLTRTPTRAGEPDAA